MPIAVLVNWSQWVSVKVKMLLTITHSKTCRNSSTGKSLGMLLELYSMKALTAARPVVVSIFVYIDTASAMKTSALLGR